MRCIKVAAVCLLLTACLFAFNAYAVRDEQSQPRHSFRVSNSKKKVLAFFFPQFHEIEENNKAWGKGFTDFTNVAKRQVADHGHPIIRPSERSGFYDLKDEYQRKFQGELARDYGIHGFVFMHYWFSNHPVMDAPLELMLKDGHPDINFCLMWANEHWTKRWDGQDGSEVYLKQTYKQGSWEPHWEWLLKFFTHKNYILVDNKPMLILYRASDIPDLQKLLKLWRLLAQEAGFDGLHVIQMNGVKWTPTSHSLQRGVDGVLEYFPNMYDGGMWPVNRVVASKSVSAVHYYGAHCGWDNTPRHSKDRMYTFHMSHPSVYKYILRQNLARTKPGGFVFVNAWNEWGEGAAIEPSLQWGRRWLQATYEAVLEEARGQAATIGPDGFARSIHLFPSGVPMSLTQSPKEKVCIIVRTYKGHSTGQYNLHQLLSSLQRLQFQNWKAYVASIDNEPWRELEQVVKSFGDERLGSVIVPSKYLEQFSWKNAGYKATDYLVQRFCLSGEFDWFLVTNGDNWYTPDALNFLPAEADMILMNFYGRYTPVTEVVTTNATLDGGQPTNCCMRFNDLACTAAAPKVGFTDLGGMILKTSKFKAGKWMFTEYDGHCSHSCHDGAMAEGLVAAGWVPATHPIKACALYHNANPVSCRLLGGTYIDSSDYYKANCVDMALQAVVPLNKVNYLNFMQSHGSCFCERN